MVAVYFGSFSPTPELEFPKGGYFFLTMGLTGKGTDAFYLNWLNKNEEIVLLTLEIFYFSEVWCYGLFMCEIFSFFQNDDKQSNCLPLL